MYYIKNENDYILLSAYSIKKCYKKPCVCVENIRQYGIAHMPDENCYTITHQ